MGECDMAKVVRQTNLGPIEFGEFADLESASKAVVDWIESHTDDDGNPTGDATDTEGFYCDHNGETLEFDYDEMTGMGDWV